LGETGEDKQKLSCNKKEKEKRKKSQPAGNQVRQRVDFERDGGG
jgi:hypothetical protein